jgi:hypothetical protein
MTRGVQIAAAERVGASFSTRDTVQEWVAQGFAMSGAMVIVGWVLEHVAGLLEPAEHPGPAWSLNVFV